MIKPNIKNKLGLFLIVLFMILISLGLLSSGENAYVNTYLNIESIASEVLKVVITNSSNSYSPANISLNPGTYKTAYCNGVARSSDGNKNILYVQAVLFQDGVSEFASDDNNTHYTNNSCYIDYNVTNPDYGDDITGNYTANYSCSFDIQYYTNPGTWNCSVYANGENSNSTTGGVDELLAITLPQSINYGHVNPTYVSDEQIVNVSNAGNVMINLSLQGYSKNLGDPFAMNCSNEENISIMYEKYNLTSSNPTIFGLGDFESLYTNLTNDTVVKKFNLNFRQQETYDDAINATYWRIYVPMEIEGTCSGNILFSATKADGSD